MQMMLRKLQKFVLTYPKLFLVLTLKNRLPIHDLLAGVQAAYREHLLRPENCYEKARVQSMSRPLTCTISRVALHSPFIAFKHAVYQGKLVESREIAFKIARR